MKTKSLFRTVLFATVATAFVSCGGSSERTQKDDVDAANLFVEQLNEKWIDGEKYDKNRFRLAKALTKQGKGYIVVMDRNPDEGIFNANDDATFFAVDISGWSSYKNAHKHMAQQINYDNAFFNLINLGDGDYEDAGTGLIFSEMSDEEVAADLRIAANLEESVKTVQIAKKLSKDGVSDSLAMRTATAMAGFANSNDRSPEAAANAIGFALGKDVSMTQVRNAMTTKSGKDALLGELNSTDQAAITNITTDLVLELSE